MASDPAQRPARATDVIARLDAVAVDPAWDQRAARDWWRDNAARLEGAAREVAEHAAVPAAAAAD